MRQHFIRWLSNPTLHEYFTKGVFSQAWKQSNPLPEDFQLPDGIFEGDSNLESGDMFRFLPFIDAVFLSKWHTHTTLRWSWKRDYFPKPRETAEAIAFAMLAEVMHFCDEDSICSLYIGKELVDLCCRYVMAQEYRFSYNEHHADNEERIANV